MEQGSINTVRGAELADRLCQIHDGLLSVIARTLPAAVAVETPFAGQNMKSLIQLAHARGVVLLAARSAGLAVFEYAPRSVKRRNPLVEKWSLVCKLNHIKKSWSHIIKSDWHAD